MRMLTAGLMTGIAMSTMPMFAAAGAAKGPTPVPAPAPVPQPVVPPSDATNGTPTPAPAATANGKTAIKTTAIRTDVPMPEKRPSGKRGGRPQYDFESLVVNASFGVLDKPWKQVNSTVSSANKRQPVVPDLNADGTAKTQITKINGVDTPVPVMKKAKVFFASPVDPATDPDKATVRIWRKS